MSQVYPPEGEAALGPIPRVRFLDPRSEEEARHDPIASSVNIPLAELPVRMHELPPPSESIVLPDLSGLEPAIQWLLGGGREVLRAPVERGGLVREARGRLWEPNGFLARLLPNLTPGRALDVGCGTGRDAVFLASRGWKVTAWDRLPDALQRARDLERRYLPGGPRVEWAQVDVERDLPEPRSFDLILMGFFLHPPILERAREWLSPGGSLVIETFSAENRRVHGRPAQAERTLDEEALPRLFAGLRLEVAEFGKVGERYLARVCARRPED